MSHNATPTTTAADAKVQNGERINVPLKDSGMWLSGDVTPNDDPDVELEFGPFVVVDGEAYHKSQAFTEEPLGEVANIEYPNRD